MTNDSCSEWLQQVAALIRSGDDSSTGKTQGQAPTGRKVGLVDSTRSVELERRMAGCELSMWYSINEFESVLRHLLLKLPSRARDAVLHAWLPKIDGHLRIADVIVFQIIRNGYASSTLADLWIYRAIKMAMETEDPSLVESLLYTLGDRSSEQADFVKIAISLAHRNMKVRRAVNHTIGRQV